MLNWLTRKGPPRSQDECGVFLLIGVLLALVKYDCQVGGGDSGVMLLRPWIQTNINFRGCHNRATMKNSDPKDLEILVTTQDFQPLIHYRFFFFLFAKITFQLSLYAFETGFWPSPRL
jgi:hypothetical protein